jgi:hypothetical protein
VGCPRRMAQTAYREARLLLEPIGGGGAVEVAPRGWFWRIWDARTERRHRPAGWLGLDLQGRPKPPANGPTNELTW